MKINLISSNFSSISLYLVLTFIIFGIFLSVTVYVKKKNKKNALILFGSTVLIGLLFTSSYALIVSSYVTNHNIQQLQSRTLKHYKENVSKKEIEENLSSVVYSTQRNGTYTKGFSIGGSKKIYKYWYVDKHYVKLMVKHNGVYSEVEEKLKGF